MTCEVTIAGRLSTITISCAAAHQGEVERGRRTDASGPSDDRHLHARATRHRHTGEAKIKSFDTWPVGCVRGCQSVREATFDVWREYGLTSIFANPGSTEINLLADLPDDFRFVLALHESSVVGMATGWAIGRGEPALAILHTTAGLGNAVGALATARVNRAPLVVARRPAGPAPPRVRAVPRGQAARARGRVPGLGRPAHAPAGRARSDRARLPRGGHRERARRS